MAYISTEEVKNIRNQLKKQFPNLKLSVVRCDSMEVSVSIMKGDIDFDYKGSVNHYCIDEHFENNEDAKNTLNKIHEITKSQNWFDKSDTQTDYFHTAYYININIGKWDKPYELLAA